MVCSGCKAAFVLANRAASQPPHLRASRECWQAFSVLMNRFYTYGNGLFPYRQWAIDAYMLQHAKLDIAAGVKAVALSLGTLQISLTAPSSVGEGPALHGRMVNAKLLPKLIQPDDFKGPEQLTVKDFVGVADEHKVKNLAHEWAKAARDRWSASLPAVDAWLKQNDYFMG